MRTFIRGAGESQPVHAGGRPGVWPGLAGLECPGRVSALPVVVIKSFTASRRNATAILEVFI